MTSPDLSPLPASRLWSDVKFVTVKVMLWVSIIAPFILTGEYLYFRVLLPAMNPPAPAPVSRPIPAPFVGPDIIVVQPPVVETTVETETIMPSQIPETQRRGKHRAPEPTGTRSIAPADPDPTRVTVTPSAPPTATEPPATPSGSSRAAPTTAPSEVATSSPTPIYDTLRSETLSTNPSLESVIPE